MNDYLFYKIMGEKGDEVQLLGFLNAVLGRTGEDRFTSVEILENKTFTPETIGKKSTTFDVRAVLQGGARVNVEVQIRNEHNMDRRSLYHWGREFVKSINAGDVYRKLPDVIAVNIVDFDFPPVQRYHSCFHLREDLERDVILTNSLEIHFINMVKYRKVFGLRRGKKVISGDTLCGEPLVRWLAWLNKNSSPELIAEVKKMDSTIVAAADKLEELLANEDAVRFYEMRFTALCDETSARNYAIETGFKKGMRKGVKEGRVAGRVEGLAKGLAKGLAEGIEKGMERSTLEIARNLKKMGLSVSQIADGTGLSPEAIEKL
jgi:predicted transposase/invertase (TIGR01784 family)